MVIEVLIMNSNALQGERVRENEASSVQEHVPGLDYSIQHAVEVQAVAHRLSDDDIDFNIEVLPRHHLNHILHLVFLHDLSHHVNILLFSLSVPVYNTVHFFAAGLCGEKGVKAVDSLGQMQDILAGEQVLVVYN